MREDGIHTPWTKSFLQSHIVNLNTPQDWRDICHSSLPGRIFLEWEALFRDECSQQSGKTRAEVIPHGGLMNSLARKTFPLEHSRQFSQQDIMSKSTSVGPKVRIGSLHPQGHKTPPPCCFLSIKSPDNPYLILFSELK